MDEQQNRLLEEIRDALAASLRCQQQTADAQRQLLEYQRDGAKQQQFQRRWFVMFAAGSTALVLGICAMLFATMIRSAPTMPIVVPSVPGPYTAYPPQYVPLLPPRVSPADSPFPEAAEDADPFENPPRAADDNHT